MEPSKINREVINKKYSFNKDYNIKNLQSKLAILPSLINRNSFLDVNSKYSYYIDTILDNKTKIYSSKRVNICLYKICKSKENIPFLMYLLNKINNIMYFPNFYTDKEILNECNNKFQILLINYKKKIIYKGFKETKNNIYIFFNCDLELELIDIKSNDKWWWTTIFEIINLKSILNFNVDRLVYSIFFKNKLLLSLFTENNKKIMSGIITFIGSNLDYTNFIAALGTPKAPPDSNLGPYYYSYTYYGAGRNAIFAEKGCSICKELTREGTNFYKRGGIVRFIIFASSGKWFLNRDNDKLDNSLTSKMLYAENNNLGNFIKLIGKLRDVNGNWAYNNDVAYVSSVFIKASQVNPSWNDRKLIIQFATRSYLQNTALSYHEVNIDNFISENKGKDLKNLPYEYKNYKIK